MRFAKQRLRKDSERACCGLSRAPERGIKARDASDSIANQRLRLDAKR